MEKKQLIHIIRKEVNSIFEQVFTTSLYGGGATFSDVGNYPFGHVGFDEEPEEVRIEMAKKKFEELKKQFDGDEIKAMDNLPVYMSLYI